MTEFQKFAKDLGSTALAVIVVALCAVGLLFFAAAVNVIIGAGIGFIGDVLIGNLIYTATGYYGYQIGAMLGLAALVLNSGIFRK